ncbi:winged helix-turn-helix transcriptional regulator [Hymenobacter sp. NBH84]|nr:winged helix-turn-helix transcriptional regulator [Hymenobacter sp. NBH84]
MRDVKPRVPLPYWHPALCQAAIQKPPVRLLRVRELLRRTAPATTTTPEVVPLGRYQFRPLRQELWLDGACTARLSARENELLLLLVQHRNGVVDRRTCLRRLWGDDNFFTARTMDVYVSRLRKHLRQDASLHILNIRGVGFKLIE